MKWVKDRSGRFAKRPHYLAEELDLICEETLGGFFRSRQKDLSLPLCTDDLTVLIETLVQSLDLYADLSQEEGDVEGVTDFVPGALPSVRISKQLTDNPKMANRLRTTLTHELGHVVLHRSLFDAPRTSSLFESSQVPASKASNMCKRDAMLNAPTVDWLEWQAGYACGAFLMPITALKPVVANHLGSSAQTDFAVMDSASAQQLVQTVAAHFAVSKDAARVRLEQKGFIRQAKAAKNLF